jgi:hypothetical protein
LPAAGIIVGGDGVGLAIAFGADARRLHTPVDQRGFDRVSTALRQILVVRVGTDTVGEPVDLHATVGMFDQELR